MRAFSKVLIDVEHFLEPFLFEMNFTSMLHGNSCWIHGVMTAVENNSFLI